jgi:hypothetical protein
MTEDSNICGGFAAGNFTVFLYIMFSSDKIGVWGLVSESPAQPASSVGIQARRTAFGVP